MQIEKKNPPSFWKNLLLGVLFLPIMLCIDAAKSHRNVLKKLLYIIFILFVFGGRWLNMSVQLPLVFSRTAFDSGLSSSIDEIHILGTSMEPTISDGSKVSLNSPVGHTFERGDIVSFRNLETGDDHYIKRVIGLENEKISISNGTVYIDGEPLSEPYLNETGFTYGNSFLTECEQYTVPEGHIAVLGDNRLVSTDSRILGFIDTLDVDGVLFPNTRPSFGSETNRESAAAVSFGSEELVQVINDWRAQQSLDPLEYDQELDEVAKNRSLSIQQQPTTWKQNLPPISETMETLRYPSQRNHEFITFGELSSDQVMSQIKEALAHKEKFASDLYTHIGFASTTVSNQQCRYPAVVVILAKYDEKILDKYETAEKASELDAETEPTPEDTFDPGETAPETEETEASIETETPEPTESIPETPATE